MLRPFPVLTVLTTLVVSGIVQGLWTDRWGPRDEAATAAARLSSLPMTIGDWDGRAKEMTKREQELAGVTGYIRRHYVNRRSGANLTLLIVCGPPGPVAVHGPEVCYRGAGYEPVGEASRYTFPELTGAAFWVRKFRKTESALPVHLRLLYSHNADGTWKATDNPRLAFARFPVLFKLYIVHELPRPDEPLQDDPALEFIRALYPDLQKTVFPTL
jgi:Protein of unknown function (DUF3485)